MRIAHRIDRNTSIEARKWDSLRALLAHAPQRLTRSVPGAHFFFLGEAGARATVRHVVELTRETLTMEEELRALLS